MSVFYFGFSNKADFRGIFLKKFHSDFLTTVSPRVTDNNMVSPWDSIDLINKELSHLEKGAGGNRLELLFKSCVGIISSNDFIDDFDEMRARAFESDDTVVLSRSVSRCKPAIIVEIMGESNNIGVNIEYFLSKCKPGTDEFDFFQLAKEGFYINSDMLFGTADFPVWIQRTESSFQGTVNKQKAKEYLKKWKSLRDGLNGYYKQISDYTVQCLEKNISK